jgi:phosphoribosyl-ATP pyrophosphohydrolase
MADFTLHDLEKRVHARAQAPADTSYTRKLLDQGVAGCAKKLGEEAIETVLAAVEDDRGRLIAETADLIYHLLVVLAARGITLAEVEAELAERTRQSGLQEKASRKDGRKPAPAAVREVKTRPRPAKARDKGRMSKGA